jgi:hypothetical protein
MRLVIRPYTGPRETLEDYKKISVAELGELARNGDKLAQEVLAPFEAHTRAALEQYLKQQPRRVYLEDLFGPPSPKAPPGPRSVFQDLEAAKAGDAEALERLVYKWFTPGKLFHHERWAVTSDRFFERIAPDVGQRRAWENLVIPALFIAMRASEFEEIALSNLYKFLRSELRREVEKDLLGGKTSDAYSEMPLSDDAACDEIEAAYRADVAGSSYADIVRQFVEELTPVQLWILTAEEGQDESIAAELGIGRSAVRARRCRLLKKLQTRASDILGGTA